MKILTLLLLLSLISCHQTAEKDYGLICPAHMRLDSFSMTLRLQSSVELPYKLLLDGQEVPSCSVQADSAVCFTSSVVTGNDISFKFFYPAVPEMMDVELLEGPSQSSRMMKFDQTPALVKIIPATSACDTDAKFYELELTE